MGGLDPEGQWRWLDAAERGAAECCQFTVEECALEGTLVGLECVPPESRMEGVQPKSGPCLF